MKTQNKGKIIFLDGKMVEADSAFMESLSPGLIKGKGVFETMRSYEGKIFVLENHLARMRRGLKLLGIMIPFTTEKIKNYLNQTLRQNKLKNASIRLMVWNTLQGKKKMAIICRSNGWPSKRQYKKGFNALVSQITKNRTNHSHIKSINYQIFRDALLEAKQKGYDEAIFLNDRGAIVEGARTNIFIIKKGTLYTPSVHCGCLNGITRYMVLQCARKIGIPCKIKAFGIKMLLTAEEAFLSNSLMNIMPLTKVNDKVIKQGQAGIITKQIINLYEKQIEIYVKK